MDGLNLYWKLDLNKKENFFSDIPLLPLCLLFAVVVVVAFIEHSKDCYASCVCVSKYYELCAHCSFWINEPKQMYSIVYSDTMSISRLQIIIQIDLSCAVHWWIISGVISPGSWILNSFSIPRFFGQYFLFFFLTEIERKKKKIS